MGNRFTKRLKRIGPVCVSVLALTVPGSGTSAQEPPKQVRMEELAWRVVVRLRKAGLHRVLVESISSCEKGDKNCLFLDGEFSEALKRVAPDLEVVPRERLLPILQQEHLMSIDIYMHDIGRAFGPVAGAEAILTATAETHSGAVEMKMIVYDASKGPPQTMVGEEKGSIPLVAITAAPPSTPIQDPDSWVYVAKFGGVTTPECSLCPTPRYTDDARDRKITGNVSLLVTVSSEGLARDIHLLSGTGSGLDQSAVATVRNWRFKPAKGPDGNPVPVRVVVEVRFRLFSGPLD